MKYPSSLDPGQIRFHQWCPAPIDPGTYTLEVRQTVSGLGDFSGEPFTFSVAGPRFSLSPPDVYSVYPPKEKSGDFANTLPHVVFTRRTLPWERPIANGQDQDHPRPWMALLVFSAEDFSPALKFPEMVTRHVRKPENPKPGEQWLINPDPSDPWVGPKLSLQSDESAEDLCSTLDVRWDLFQRTAPHDEDLEFLAHVREVNTKAKETSSLLADGWFSVVLANRFPRSGGKAQNECENRAYLVSLEGLEDYLPGTNKTPENKPVRLAVLSSWSFRCSEAITFKSSMANLDVGRMAIPLWQKPVAEELEPAQNHVREAYQRGYAALNHSTRLGEKTVSWYRGPLVPFYLVNQMVYPFLPVADAAVRYDPLQGMMDVTYAGAFQLGRLLALQDRHFAASLYAYRTRVRRHLNGIGSKSRLREVIGGTVGSESEPNMMLRYLGNSRDRATSWSNAKEGDFEPAKIKSRIKTKGLEVPDDVREWLGRLLLLYRVPFNYLVSDERMLPNDSIRFFFLDPGWLNCLLQGACSVGRASSRDELVDQELRNNFLRYAIMASRKIRDPQAGDGKGDWTQLTGFLLRSPVVEGWQGLEMRAWGWSEGGDGAKKEVELQPLRIDRLAPDMVLCIFDGKLKRIEIKQPPEGMHFGATKSGTKTEYTSSALRSLAETSPGKQLEPRTTIPVKLRGEVNDRVLNIKALVAGLQIELANDGGKTLTSAGFGVSMVESPGKVSFDADYHDSGQAGPR